MQSFCLQPGCGALVPSGRCATHARSRPLATRPAGHRWYSCARWRRLRAELLREEPFCRTCRAQGRNVLTAEIDHIVKHDGDPGRFWDRNNCQGLCAACHHVKTGRGG